MYRNDQPVDKMRTRTFFVLASVVRDSAYLANIDISVFISFGSRFQFSVENAYTVAISMPSCMHHCMKSTKVCPPAQCPCVIAIFLIDKMQFVFCKEELRSLPAKHLHASVFHIYGYHPLSQQYVLGPRRVEILMYLAI